MKIRQSKSIFALSIVLMFGIFVLTGGLMFATAHFNEEREAATAGEDSEAEGESRDAWFYGQRAYPLKVIPAGARAKALKEADELEARYRQRLGLVGGELSPAERLAEEQAQQAWQSLGPTPIGQQIGFFPINFGDVRVACSGRVSAIALHPQYDGTSNQIVYLGAAQGGVWRSTDNGATWTALTDNQPSLAIGDIAIDPNNPNVIWAGTGEGNPTNGTSYYGAGLLKSTDGGNTWQVIVGPNSTIAPNQPVFINTGVLKIEIDPTNSNTVYVTTSVGKYTTSASNPFIDAPLGQRGLWKTTDGGQTWTNLNVTEDGGRVSATDVFTDPLNRNRVFAAMAGFGVFRSENGGQTWTYLEGGLPADGFNRVVLAVGPPVAPSTNSTIYAGFAATNSQLLGIWRSTNNAASWTQVTSPQDRGQANYNLALVADPNDGATVYYATSASETNDGGTLWRSTNAGQTWTDISFGDGVTGGLHADSHVIAIPRSNSNVLFTGNDGGIWRTGNAKAATVAWRSLNQTLSITQFQAIALHPTNPGIIIGGTQDNGTNRTLGQASWDNVAEGDGGFPYIDQSNPNIFWQTYQNTSSATASNFGPRVSNDQGLTWTNRRCRNCEARAGGFNPTDRVNFFAPLTGHPGFTGAAGNVVYFGTMRIYRTNDFGETWRGIGPSSDGFGADLTKGTGRLSAIAPHPKLNPAQGSDPQGEVIWAGTTDGNIQVTTDAGKLGSATWTNVTRAPLPNRWVADIALDPNDQRRAIACFTGFNANTPTTPGKLFLTTNQGQSWTDISGDLPDIPTSTAVIDPMNPNTYYAGTDIGVFQTTNGGQNWIRLGTGLPRVAVLMLRYHAATRSIVAATHGRGIWRLPLGVTAKSVATVSAASFNGQVLAAEAMVAAFGETLATKVEIASTVPLPTNLAGTVVKVRDSAGVERDSPLFFVAPSQVNYLIPAGTAIGAATVTITSGDGALSQGAITIANVAPGLFAANANGQGIAAVNVLRVKADGSQIYESAARFDGTKFVPVEIDLGPEGEQVFLIVFGTGFRGRSDLSAVKFTIGGAASEVFYVGPQGGFVGLDQANIRIPRSLVGRGVVDIVMTADGRTANTVQIQVK